MTVSRQRPPEKGTVVITAIAHCLLIDGTGAEPIEDGAVIIEGDRIVAAGKAAETRTSQADRTIDLKGMALLPGLINLHVHYGLKLPGGLTATYAEESESALAFRMASNAREALHIGVTTTRSVGEHRGADFALRAAINAGRVEGPRMFTSGAALCITGGHGSRLGGTVIECDGPYEFRKAARAQIKLGADQIKIMISGGIAGEVESIKHSQMAMDEMENVCLAAHNAGKKVCAHSGAPRAMLDAIRAGVDCMEHGYFLNDEVAAVMVEKGTFLVPTVCVSRAEEYMRRIGVPDWMIRKSLDAGEQHWQALKTAIRRGVKVAMGTDMLPADPNDGTFATYREMEHMQEAGMTPMDVIVAATSRAAEVVDARRELGSLEPGKLADLIACPGNPASGVGALRNTAFVMKGGEIVRQDARD